MEKNQQFTTTVTSMGYNGEGIAQIEDKVVFIPFALLDEIVEVKILKVEKNIAYGKLINVIKPSAYRIKPICPVFGKCGGCQYQHVLYEKQADLKGEVVKQCFSKIAGINITPNQTVKSDFSYAYRNKLQLPVRREDGVTKIGFYALNSHRIIEIDSCPLHPNWVNAIITAFKKYIFENNVLCYSEKDRSGSLRHIVVRCIKDKFLIVAVTKSKLVKINELISILKEYITDFSLFISENKKDDNVILGDKCELVYGKGVITDVIEDISYDISPESFVQINDNVKNKLYSDVKSILMERKDLPVIDGYAGVGLISAMISKEQMECYPIEIVPQAIVSANKIVRENNLSSMHPICADCAEIIPKIIDKIGKNYQIYLDPTRKGVDKNTLIAIKKSKPQRIIYCSCSPQTLARDVGYIMATIDDSGKIVKENIDKSIYKIESVTPYDMFPQTKHVETVAILSLIN